MTSTFRSNVLQLLKAKIQKNISAVVPTEKAEVRKNFTKFYNDKRFLCADLAVLLLKGWMWNYN